MVNLGKKLLVAYALVISGVAQPFGKAPAYTGHNYAHLFATEAPAVLAPTTVAELQALVATARTEGKKIALVGAGKSMGGQTVPTALSDYRVSLEHLNKLIQLNVPAQEVTVQAGMSWRALQEHIAPHKLAIKTMQSYHDFSIGGSLSVNIHGQDIRFTQIIGSVVSFTLLQPDGTIITVSRQQNKELFGLVIGGYGLLGIIIEVTLSLTDDALLERKVALIESKDLADYFVKNVKNNPDVEFYSARFSMSGPQILQQAFVITYERTNKNIPELFKFNASPQSKAQKALLALMANVKMFKNLRFPLEKFYLNRSEFLSRNNFTNHTIESLPANTPSSHYILQEYFIPYAQVNTFIDFLATSSKAHAINILNVTARHLRQDNESKLAFAQQECCALVVYINLARTPRAYATMVDWTRTVIDTASACGGTYYLPYQLLGTQEQLETAYPAFKEFVALKRQSDPKELFTNQLYQRYSAAVI